MTTQTFEKAQALDREIRSIAYELEKWDQVDKCHTASVRLMGSYNNGYYLESTLDIMWLKEIEVKRLKERIADLVKQFNDLQCQ